MQSVESSRHEQARVAHHIAGAERVLARSKSRPTRLKRLVRALLLEELTAYRARGVFPKNRDFPERPMPYLIDEDGTRCAMAHLLELGGAASLVLRLAAERNSAFVRELADEPELLAWLDAAGLEVTEAARIQPSYSCLDNATPICGVDPGKAISSSGPTPITNASGVLELKVVRIDGGDAVAHVERTYGPVGDAWADEEIVARLVADGASIGDTILVPVTATTLKQARDAAARETGARQAERPDAAPVLPSVGYGLLVANDRVSIGQRAITKDQAIDATISGKACRTKLAAVDASWTENVEGCSDSKGGCSVGGEASSSAATIQILIALVSAGVGRRLLRRR